jgi:S1-C subfamily serine protease
VANRRAIAGERGVVVATWLAYGDQEYDISPGGVTIGRGAENDLVLPGEQTSRHHARVWETEGTVYIRDLGSKNGTLVNGRRISGDALLRAGDRIHIGRAVLTVHSGAPATFSQQESADRAVAAPARRSVRLPASVRIGPAVVVVVCLLGAGVVFIIAKLPANPASSFFAMQASSLPTPTIEAIATTIAQPPVAPTAPTPSTPTATALPSIDVMNRVLKSVVLVEVPLDNSRTSMSGSGTVVNSQGFVLTNAHVVRDEKTGRPYNSRDLIFVIQGDNPNKAPDRVYRGRILIVDADLDLALLKVIALRDGSPLPADLTFSTIPLGNSDGVQIGQEIRVIGFPSLGGDTITISRGIVSGFLENGKWIKTDTEINPGNSGGAAVNTSGESIGIPSGVVSGRVVTGKMGYILSVNKARSILEQTR